MKFNYLAVLGIATVLTISCAKEATSKQVNMQMQHTTTAGTLVAQMMQEIAGNSGTFKAGEHPNQGTVSVVSDKGKRYLEFDQGFKTDNGSDLYVILHPNDAPAVSGFKNKDYVTIARNVNLADFRSVAVWCRKFHGTFG